MDTTKSKPTLGVALVGLGKYSAEQLAPALKETELCELRAIVTGDRKKALEWQRQYGIPEGNTYNYETFDTIGSNPDIDIVYIVLPNSLHAEYTIRAARAGKHIICEKPMAVNIADCERMIEACKKSGTLLSIGYRLHFEPYNATLGAIGSSRAYGSVKSITTKHSLDIKPGVWRLNKNLAGGGPLMDVGIYCVQAAIYAMGENPIAVSAKEGPRTDLSRFAEVEQSISWTMEFSNGVVARCESAYDKEEDLLHVDMLQDFIELQPAFAYEGLKAKTGKGKLEFLQVNQQARQMDDFARCILRKQESRVSGEMGLRDVRILMAIYEAARTGKRIEINGLN